MTLVLGPLYSGKKAFACKLLHCDESELSHYAVWNVQERAQLRRILNSWPKNWPVIKWSSPPRWAEVLCRWTPSSAQRGKRQAA